MNNLNIGRWQDSKLPSARLLLTPQPLTAFHEMQNGAKLPIANDL